VGDQPIAYWAYVNALIIFELMTQGARVRSLCNFSTAAAAVASVCCDRETWPLLKANSGPDVAQGMNKGC
jgi:hypothetical protein